jgi:hypothetical protein
VTEDDRKEFTEIFDILAEGFNFEMTAVRYQFYLSALSDLSIVDIRRAANHIARSATFFPKPVDFRSFIEGNTEDRAILAWTVAQKNKNVYLSIKFEDKVIHGAIEAMGGWVKFCRMDDYKEEAWQMKDFIKMYKVVGNRECPDYLIGETEIRNSEGSFTEFICPPKQVLCDYASGQQKEISND